jgi:DNA modification methylase
MNLEQELLDVKTKIKSNIFNWRGQFTPQFVEYILREFTKQGDSVFDPFSGSGTVLLEAAKLGRSAVGYEINPSAYAMSRFFSFCNMTHLDRSLFLERFEAKLRGNLDKLGGERVYVENSDFRLAYSSLLNFSDEFNCSIADRQERIFLLNMLFQSEKDKSLLLKDSIAKSFAYLKKNLNEIPFSDQPIKATLNDARKAGEEYDTTFDLIFTSPPYINVFNYHQNYRAIIESFGFDILKVAQSEFGSNRKNRGNRFKTVVQYCLDMELALNAFWKVLKDQGKIVLVLGRESNVRGVSFGNGKMVMEMIQNSNCFTILKVLERKFTNKFGLDIWEDIIIATKNSSQIIKFDVGRSIALNHLKDKLSEANDGVKLDIQDAISSIDSISASPLFDSNNILRNV